MWVILFQIFITKIDFFEPFFFISLDKKRKEFFLSTFFYDLSYLEFLDIQEYDHFCKLGKMQNVKKISQYKS